MSQAVHISVPVLDYTLLNHVHSGWNAAFHSVCFIFASIHILTLYTYLFFCIWNFNKLIYLASPSTISLLMLKKFHYTMLCEIFVPRRKLRWCTNSMY